MPECPSRASASAARAGTARQLEQQPGRGDLGDTGIDHHPRFVRESGEDLALCPSAGDRVEIGDIELVESECPAAHARDPDRVRAHGDLAAQGAIAFALAAHGVNAGSALEIDDRDHPH